MHSLLVFFLSLLIFFPIGEANAITESGFNKRLKQIRADLKSNGKNTTARNALVGLTIESVEQIQSSEALEREQRAQVWENRIKQKLVDTLWRLKSQASKGKPDAQAALGTLYRRGILVDRDLNKACDFYQRAALTKKVAWAGYEYARCLPSDDHLRVRLWLLMAASGHHSGAQEAVARLCLQKKPVDQACVTKWLSLAAQQKRPSAQSLKAWYVSRGEFFPKNRAEAISLYQSAAAQGHLGSLNNLGQLFETSAVSNEEQQTAAQYYERAALAGFPPAQVNLARLFLDGKGVAKDYEIAEYWLLEAKNSGSKIAIQLLNWMKKQKHLK